MKKKNVIPDNYLERIPVRRDSIAWSSDEQGIVTLEIENKGFANRVAQKLLKKPKISYIHLDGMGSYIWPLIDGSSTIMRIAESVDEHFGEESHPLYERLAKFFQILDSYGFITWNN